MTPLTITVYGKPAPQGSKRHVGNGILIESSKALHPWRADVRTTAHQHIRCTCPNNCGKLLPGYPIEGPVAVRMVFTMIRPRSHYRTGRNSHLLRPDAPTRPHTPPDLSKLIRSTEDALTAAGVWRDDARVVEYTRAAKVWAGEDPESLDAPGCRIVIQPLDTP